MVDVPLDEASAPDGIVDLEIPALVEECPHLPPHLVVDEQVIAFRHDEPMFRLHQDLGGERRLEHAVESRHEYGPTSLLDSLQRDAVPAGVERVRGSLPVGTSELFQLALPDVETIESNGHGGNGSLRDDAGGKRRLARPWWAGETEEASAIGQEPGDLGHDLPGGHARHGSNGTAAHIGKVRAPARTSPMREIATRLAEIPGVVAVTLGGSRATGTATHDSDWDFGLYYRDTIDPADVRALGWAGQVFAPGDWGQLVNGGAWLEIGEERVDLVYRRLDDVLHWTAEAEGGRFEIQREVGYVAGIATYILAGELALGEVLAGALPRPSFPEQLRETAPPLWQRLAAGALHFARVHAQREDRVATMANLAQAVLSTAEARLAARGEWALNEKRIVTRAGLDDVQHLLHGGDLVEMVQRVAEALDAPRWR